MFYFTNRYYFIRKCFISSRGITRSLARSWRKMADTIMK